MPKNCILRLFFYIIPILVFSGRLWGHSPHKAKPVASHHYFVENKGQWAGNILFRAEIQQGNVLVTKEGITYQLFTSIEDTSGKNENLDPHLKSKNSRIKGHIVNANFGNASFDKFTSSEIIPTKFQYLKGKDQSKWTTRVNAWKQLTFHEIYNGIDLKLYFEGAKLKYDFILRANANPDNISIHYDGANNISIESGFLAIETSIGNIYEQPPYSYQIIENKKKEVKCQFRLEDKHVRFKLTGKYDQTKPLIIDPELVFSTYSGSRADNFGNTATYDDAGHLYSGGIVFNDRDAQLPTMPGSFDSFKGGGIDAFILKYSPDGTQLLSAVYLGGTGSEYPISMIVNKSGHLAILGITSSNDFPVTSNAFDTNFNGGPPISIFAGVPNDVVFPDFYTADPDFNNGSDIFIAIIDMNIQTMQASTFLGGNNTDGYLYTGLSNSRNYGDQLRGEIMVDEADNVYIISQTNSDTLDKAPTFGLEYRANHGRNDALIAKFNPSLSNLEWVRFLGGSGRDAGFGIRVDSSSSEVYVTGGTNSANLFNGPATGLITNFNGIGNGFEQTDGYVAKISADGSQILNSTYLGTPQYDQCYFIDLDYNKDVYVFGQTRGLYPVTPGVYSNPNSGQFIHKLDNDLAVTRFSTVIGSGTRSPDISPTAFMVNNCRKIFLSGWGGITNRNGGYNSYYVYQGSIDSAVYNANFVSGSTTNLPITNDAYQKTSTGSGFYFAILQPEATGLAYATHFGGSANNQEHVDGGTSRFDKKGIIYQSLCAGCRGFNNFPISNQNVWSTTNNSINCNNAAIKFDLGKVVADFESFDSLTAIPSKYGCVPITFRIKNKSSGATNYKWEVGNGVLSFKDDSIFIKFTQRGFQKITLIAFDTSICRLVDTARSTVNAGDVRVDFVPDIKQCGLSPVIPNIQLYTPWAKVTWSPTDGLSDPTIAKPTISYTGKDQIYYISVTDDTLCMKFDTLSVKMRDPKPKTKLKVLNSETVEEQYSFCLKDKDKGFLTTKSTLYDYIEWKEDGNPFNQEVDSFYHSFPHLGKIKYEVSIYDSICNRSASDTKIVTISQPQPTYPTDAVVCPNTPVKSQVIGENGFTYLWKPESLFSNPTSDVQTFLPKRNERISIIVTDTIGCVDSSGYNISIFESIQAITDKEFKYCRRKTDGIEIYSNMLNSYVWEPGGFTGNPLNVTASGTYFLTGLDVNNCPVKDTIKVIERCDPELYVPNAFSPNGDGQNDFFEVFGYDVSQFDIKIFDRWGEIIYHSTDFKFNWDGKYKNQTVPIGTYPFVISYKGTTFEGESVSKTFSGDVTLVR